MAHTSCRYDNVACSGCHRWGDWSRLHLGTHLAILSLYWLRYLFLRYLDGKRIYPACYRSERIGLTVRLIIVICDQVDETRIDALRLLPNPANYFDVDGLFEEGLDIILVKKGPY